MASSRKKLDEKHLRILRELVSLPSNKQCFDCHQRGPTYINMTIGSFVCTSCSGMLRGLTPPHRVKSISMASFSPEEVELIKSRGNDYCRQIWLGLYDANDAHDTKDEQQIKDFMIAKYEKKRYYMEPSVVKNDGSAGFSPSGTQTNSHTGTPTHVASVTTSTAVTTPTSDIKPLSSLLGSQVKPLNLNVQTSVTNSSENMFTPDRLSNEFLADFGSPDPFNSSTQSTSLASQPSFANFENNPIFNSSNNHMFGIVMNSDNVPPRYNSNRWSMPTSAMLSTMSNSFSSPARTMSGLQQSSPFLSTHPPAEDRYAALKDLDSLMKTQQASSEPQFSDWSTATSTAATWSVNGPTTSQAGFLNVHAGGFSDTAIGSTVNPFTGTIANSWVSSGSNGIPNSSNPPSGFGANPFRTRPGQPGFGMNSDAGAFGWGNVGVSGMPNGQVLNGGLPPFHPTAAAFPTSHSMNFSTKTWHNNAVGNPFVLGASPASTGHSSNPFL
ncbi:Arf-GAP domain and FG repeats-containing protein 1 [Zootermopsis nevadensis]|uniref:Arf-GAP domain and FG repeats-containing protein 1 n=2 Tax=Zootermopsis nevadensis TaxID=136037 RepID=A0A067R9W8_ZOONE|nr:Arf-GAP domain and FG repeats-containing protein 1 [Zootermopsis nevadensis]